MRPPRFLVLLAAVAALAAAGLAVASVRSRAERFDADRAWRDVVEQVKIGPRPAGSPQLRALADQIRRRLPHGRFEAVPGHPGLRNVVGHVAGTRPAVVIAAHYDTKEIPGFVGANDGAGGTAALLELARVLGHAKRPARAPELRFVFFDGEENVDDAIPFYTGGLRGSKAYAAAHAADVRALVLLDFVADRQLAIPREAGSDSRLWSRLRDAARRVDSQRAFPPGTRSEILDDHTPFARAGIPAIDLIDFTYPCWHQRCDDLDHVSKRSLDRAGEAVLELVRTWR